MADMNNPNHCDSCDDCILYELLVYSEWKQDPEVLVSKRKFTVICPILSKPMI